MLLWDTGKEKGHKCKESLMLQKKKKGSWGRKEDDQMMKTEKRSLKGSNKESDRESV